jgi:hypothetical protein
LPILAALACAGWTIFAGKDLNWDLLNYHYYAPYQLLGGRLGQDYFAASAQGYLNPLGYLPFYLMVSWGWHSVLVSVLLAAAHGGALALLYAIAWRLFAPRAAMALVATALGAASAVFWATVGTSFLDPLLVVPMLGGLLLLLERRAWGLAGFLFGCAAALKYSNAIYALAAAPLAFAGGRRAAVAYVGGGALGVALLAGPWLALMAHEFGNPLFPGLTAGGGRFAPRDLLAALLLPFRMAVLDRSLYAEIFAPDLRFAALALLALAVPFRHFQFRIEDRRLFAFFALAYVLWVVTSANSRYGMLLLLLAGVCVARLAEALMAPRIARVSLGVLLALQLVAAIVAAPSRWFIAEPWSARWLPYEPPARALRAPALYLSLETLPMAAVAPFLHPGSSFVNVRGQHTIDPGSPRLAALVERHRGRVRTLGRAADHHVYAGMLAYLGYRLDAHDCFTIAWRRDDDDALSRAANWLSRTPPTSEPLSVQSCALAAAPRDAAQLERERRVSAIFDRVERTCARLFRGQSAVTEPFGGGWLRHYVDLDARLELIGERLVLNRYRAGVLLDLGRLSDWEREGFSSCP